MDLRIKRPFTLLCLSDLHYSDNGDVLKKLGEAIRKMPASTPPWTPDFIVIAGDLVHYDQKDKYNDVLKRIDDLICGSGFRLGRFHVIAVPGNHDKDITLHSSPKCYRRGSCRKCKVMRQNRELKDALLGENLSFDDKDVTLQDRYDGNFKSFGAFYRNCVEVKRGVGEEYVFPAEILGGSLSNVALTSGLKVFHDAKVCFLCINTEWTYFPTTRIEDRIRKCDDGFLCAPLIYSSLKTYREKYRDFTLVTVMHRNPADLPWETRFRADPYKPDILRHLYQFSDVILTGHNHIERMQPPHRMENHAQLIQLGSSSLKCGNNHLQQYYASMIRIDPIAGQLNTCTLRYDHGQDVWEPFFDKKDYPLAHYAAMLPPGTPPSQAESIVVPLSSHQDEEIRHALNYHFPDLEKGGYTIRFKNINDSGLEQWIMENVVPGDKSAFFLYSLTHLDHERFSRLRATLLSEDEYKAFRTAFYRKECLLMEVWFKGRDFEGDLDYPFYRPALKRSI